jgi:hypothetical protein
MDLEELDLISIAVAVANADPSEEIEFYYDETIKILAHLEYCATVQVMENEYLREATRNDYTDDEEYVTLGAVRHFFSLMRIYFDRTLHSPGHRLVTIDQLRCELDVYVWTLLSEWVQAHCDDETRDWVLQENGPTCVSNANFGAPAAVLELWYECVEDVVGVLIWRDEEVRWRRAESGVVFCILLVMFFWVI